MKATSRASSGAASDRRAISATSAWGPGVTPMRIVSAPAATLTGVWAASNSKMRSAFSLVRPGARTIREKLRAAVRSKRFADAMRFKTSVT